MTLNRRYITTRTLEPLLVDRVSNQPLANGTVEFFKDTDRNTQKNVYQLTGAPPNYEFEALPNPVELDINGCFNSNGNNVALYYMPYDTDASDNVELYYVVVKNSNGDVQFTRQAWPSIQEGSSEGVTDGTINNQIINSQFVDVNFVDTLSYPYGGAGSSAIAIAPYWDLIFSYVGAGTLMLTRSSVAGSLQVPTNPAFVLTVTPGANISAIKLRQRLSDNSSLLTPATGGSGGFVNTGLLLYANSSAAVNYVPSTGSTQLLFNQVNATASPLYLNETVQLVPSNNTDSGADAYVDIEIVLSTDSATTLSSAQIVGMNASATNVAYRQDSVNMQQSLLFGDYNPRLQFKPTNSFLIGWDFPLNPAQIRGSSVTAITSGANTSNYIWDQTIAFQTFNAAFSFARSTVTGGIKATCVSDGAQLAYVQYINVAQSFGILTDYLSIMVRGLCSDAEGLDGSISLWWSDDVNLPDMGANASLIATLGADGRPATFNGNWTEITRENLFDTSFSLTTSRSDKGFAQWVPTASARANAVWVAIVVGFEAMPVVEDVNIQSISLVPGLIPTIPAPLTKQTVLQQCQAFYEKSFDLDVIAAQNVSLTAAQSFTQTAAAATPSFTPTVNFKTTKWRLPDVPDVTVYNPAAPNAQIRNVSVGGDCNTTILSNVSQAGFSLGFTSNAGSSVNDKLAYNWSVDVRYGY